jgi:hypothetical protein
MYLRRILKLDIGVLPPFLGRFSVFCRLMGCLELMVWCSSNWRCFIFLVANLMMNMFLSKHVANMRTKRIAVCRLDVLWVFETLNTEKSFVYIFKTLKT